MATAMPGTMLAGTVMPGGANGAFLNQIQDGQMTVTVYTLIREEKYQEAVTVLNNQLQWFPRSRAALSLLAYCYYQIQDFNSVRARSREDSGVWRIAGSQIWVERYGMCWLASCWGWRPSFASGSRGWIPYGLPCPAC
jgi:hypothetical protein